MPWQGEEQKAFFSFTPVYRPARRPMRPLVLSLLLAMVQTLCAHPYNHRVKIADETLAQAIETLNQNDRRLLAQGLREASAWLKRSHKFSAAFPKSAPQFKTARIKVDF